MKMDPTDAQKQEFVHMDFSDDNELDIQNLIDSDEPELRRLDDAEEKKNEDAVKFDVLHSLLSDYGDDGTKLADHFRILKIEYRDLASLSDDDLKQFGVDNSQKRQLILDEFAQLPNQSECYDNALVELDARKYEHDSLKNIQKHLKMLKISIKASLLKLQLQPADDICFQNNLNASDLVLKTLEEINKTSILMEKQLSKLTSKKNNLKTSKYSKFWKVILLLGATAVSSAIYLKYCRTKLF